MLRYLVLSAALVVGTAASATPIYTQTTPAGADALFPGGPDITFDSVPAGTYSTYTQSGVTFTPDSGTMFIDSAYIGEFNTFGTNSLHNCYCGASFGQLTFTFAQPVNGFGFFWGASDDQWTLSAYSTSNALLESYLLPITHFSNAGDFVGLRDAGIAYATLVGPSGDYVFIDNFHTTAVGAVPLPASAPLFGAAIAALGMLGFGMKRRNAAASA